MTGNTEGQNWKLSKDKRTLSITVQENFSDLEKLQNYQNIKELRIDLWKLSDNFNLEPLALIPRLQKLTILQSPEANFSVVGKLSRLRELHISTDHSVDVTPLRKHPAIRKIHIEASEFFGIGILNTLPNLRSVKLFGVREDEIEYLHRAKLSYLETDFFKISGRRNIKEYFYRVFGVQTERARKRKRIFRNVREVSSLLRKYIVQHAEWTVPIALVFGTLITFLSLLLGK